MRNAERQGGVTNIAECPMTNDKARKREFPVFSFIRRRGDAMAGQEFQVRIRKQGTLPGTVGFRRIMSDKVVANWRRFAEMPLLSWVIWAVRLNRACYGGVCLLEAIAQ